MRGPHEQRLGRVHAALQVRGDLGNGQIVEVAEGERGPVLGCEVVEGFAGPHRVEVRVPGILGAEVVADGAEAALLPRLAAPVVHELVPGDPDEPGDGHREDAVPADGVGGGEERLGGQVLGDRSLVAAGEEVAVDVADRRVVELQETRRARRGGLLAHTRIIVRAADSPTVRPRFLSFFLPSLLVLPGVDLLEEGDEPVEEGIVRIGARRVVVGIGARDVRRA